MWQNQIARKIKEGAQQAREKALSDASVFIGTIKQLRPELIIQIGELMYAESEGEIIKSHTFSKYTPGTNVFAGDDVIVLPVNSLDTICVIDKVG